MNNVCIPDWQKKFHFITELASVLYVPLVLSAANDIKEPHKTRLRLLAYGMILIDGYLLLRWLTLNQK